MAYRLHGERVTLALDDGPTIEVQPIASDTVYRTAVGLASAYFAATDPAALSAALERLATYFCMEAEPTWEMVDHRGTVPATPAGMLRMPDTIALTIMSDWAELFVAEPPATAVDKLMPEGPLRDRLNRQLRAVA
jgi:hypothetical protein